MAHWVRSAFHNTFILCWWVKAKLKHHQCLTFVDAETGIVSTWNSMRITVKTRMSPYHSGWFLTGFSILISPLNWVRTRTWVQILYDHNKSFLNPSKPRRGYFQAVSDKGHWNDEASANVVAVWRLIQHPSPYEEVQRAEGLRVAGTRQHKKTCL